MHTLERQADQLKRRRHLARRPDRARRGAAARPVVDLLKKMPARAPVAGAPKPRPYALLVPGGSAHRLEKRWPVEHYAELAGFLRAQGLDVVIIGGPQESALARAIQKAVGRARDLTGRTDFAQIAALGPRRPWRWATTPARCT
jgi:ADP-heptose:LPS heptosyltransferase